MRHKLLLLILLSLGVLFFAPQVGNEKPRDVLFKDSYMTQMRRMTGSGMAEMRAEDARFYQVCDAHHQCGFRKEVKVAAKVRNAAHVCWIRNVGSYQRVCIL